MLPTAIDIEPAAFLASVGEVFAVFDTQDSGNVSYGARVNGVRYFVKTPGRLDDPKPPLGHPARAELLRNAVAIARECPHHTCPRLHGVIESPTGPLLVYDWFDGELLNAAAAQRADPTSAYQRFRALPASEIASCLTHVYELHERLAERGWIAIDFYDGCLMYDFDRREVRVVDIDMYHRGPLRNTMGRMFGSTRFMAPEEFELGALVDERTTVFNLGRAACEFLGDRGTSAQLAAAEKACLPGRAQRFATVTDFARAWRDLSP